MNLGSFFNTFFDDVFVMTLQRSKERQINIARQLDKHNIKFKFIEGVDGRTLNIKDIEEKNIYNRELNFAIHGEYMTPGEIAVSMSTLNICRKIVDENLKSVLILQDDARILEENIKYCNAMLSAVDIPWDILYLSHSKTCLSMSLRTRLKLTADTIRHLVAPEKFPSPKRSWLAYRRPYNKYWFWAGHHFGTWSYGLTIEGARKLIEAFSPIFSVDDSTISHLIMNQQLTALSPKFFLFDHNLELPSEIGYRPSWDTKWPS